MKKLFAYIIWVLLAGIQVHAQDLQEISGYCGKDGENIKWTVNTVAGTLVFQGSGEMASYDYVGEQPWMAYKSSITTISVGEGITSITNNSFANMSFGSITLPTSLESLGTFVFQNCKQLKQIDLPINLASIGGSAFAGSSIESIKIPYAIKSIPSSLCLGCDKLIKVEVANDLTDIGDYAFYGCSSLSSITLPTTLTSIGSNAFSDCANLTEVILPANLGSIGNGAFQKTGLLSITIPASINQLENSTFDSCEKLAVVNLNEGISSIGRNCFRGCTSLKTISLPASLSRLNVFAFSGCTALEVVKIEGPNTYLGDYAFSGCTSLTNVVLPEGFSDTCFGNNVFENCSSLAPLYNSTTFFYMPNDGTESYTIPEGITTIANSAFKGNEGLKHLQLPSTVNRFGDYAFSMSKIEELDLSKLEYVTLGEGCFSNSSITKFISPTKIANCPQLAFEGCKNITELDLSGIMKVPGWIYVGNLGIGNYAFKNCENLKIINLPQTVDRLDIGNYTFQNCSSLETFDFSNIGTISMNAFENCKSLKKVVISDFGKNQIGTFINPHCFAGCTSLDSVVIGSSGCLQFFMSAFEGCSNLKSITINAESIPKIFDLQYPPYNGLWEKGFSEYDLPFANTIFTMYGYLVDECLVGADQEFWNKVPFDRVYETLSGECGDQGNNITWSLDTKDGVLHINGSGNMMMPEDADVITWKDRSKAVKQIELSDDIESICSNAFSGCPIKTINLNKHLKSIGDYAFSYTELESVSFNDEIVSIGNWAFGNCDYLQNIEVSNSVKVMGYSVFSYCANLLTAILPSNLESIGMATFNQCSNIKSVVMPKRIASIPQYTFGGCMNLSDLYLPASTPPSAIGCGLSEIFNNSMVIHIPQGAKTLYTNSSIWNSFNNWDEYYAYVNVQSSGSGTLKIEDDTISTGNWDDYLTMGEPFEMKLIPNEYFEVSNITVNGVDCTDAIENNTVQFTNVSESKSIQITFAPMHFSFTVDVQGRGHVYVLGHDIEASGKLEVTHDNQIDISVLASEGYKLEKVLLNDIDITSQILEGGYIINNPTQDLNINVSFVKDTFKLTYLIGDEIYKEVEYEFESAITPEPIPAGDYKYFEWIGLPETMPAHDVVVTASYETGILEILMQAKNNLRIFTPDGKRVNSLQKGLNIIVSGNGERKKIFVK